jgi:transcriptional regulator with XRE-family HTH domain
MADSNTVKLRGKILGTLIREARETVGKTVEECAQALGVSGEEFQALENGNNPPSLPELEVIAFFLDVPLEHFWENKALSDEEAPNTIAQVSELMLIRNRMIGALIRQARLEADLSLEALSQQIVIPVEQLVAFEMGKVAVPIPDLELLSSTLNRSIREFQDRHGPVGRWAIQRRVIHDFLEMPEELQEFASKPLNRPYLELAQRLSEMSVEKLRAVAEGLLEITY